MSSRDSSIFKDLKNTKITGPSHISIYYLVWLLQKNCFLEEDNKLPQIQSNAAPVIPGMVSVFCF